MCGILEGGMTVGHPGHRPIVRLTNSTCMQKICTRARSKLETFLILLLLLLRREMERDVDRSDLKGKLALTVASPPRRQHSFYIYRCSERPQTKADKLAKQPKTIHIVYKSHSSHKNLVIDSVNQLLSRNLLPAELANTLEQFLETTVVDLDWVSLEFAVVQKLLKLGKHWNGECREVRVWFAEEWLGPCASLTTELEGENPVWFDGLASSNGWVERLQSDVLTAGTTNRSVTDFQTALIRDAINCHRQSVASVLADVLGAGRGVVIEAGIGAVALDKVVVLWRASCNDIVAATSRCQQEIECRMHTTYDLMA